MKIVYSLPHPADRLRSEEAGHMVRANAILNVLEQRGHEIVIVEAAAGSSEPESSGAGRDNPAVSAYRNVVRRFLPRRVAMWMRDNARVAFSRRYAFRLAEVVTRVQPDVILETHVAYSLGGKIASVQTGVPLVLDDVAPSWEEDHLYGTGSNRLAVTTHREVTGHASYMAAVSGAMKRYLIEDGIPEDRLVLISNGIEADAFRPDVDGSAHRERYGIPPEAVVIVFVGSFQPYHRVDLLLRAAAQLSEDLPPVRLLLVGGGKRLAEPRALAAELGLDDRTIFTGRVPYEDVAGYVAAGDIAIMPATNPYGNPMKVYEYMALGKAVVGPRQETITEIITEGEDGLLFEPEDVGAMADVLRQLVADAALRERLGQQAAAAAQGHTWARRGAVMEQTLQRAVEDLRADG